jgi:hypothetical protein
MVPQVIALVNENPEQPHVESNELVLIRSQRNRKSMIPNGYEIYMSENIDTKGDPTSFEEAMSSANSSKWPKTMEDETKPMSTNQVWDLVEISREAKSVCCKCVYMTKHDSKGNVERFKTRRNMNPIVCYSYNNK